MSPYMSCPQQQHALTSLSCGPPTGSRQSAGRVNGIHDQLRHLLRVGDQREVAESISIVVACMRSAGNRWRSGEIVRS